MKRYIRGNSFNNDGVWGNIWESLQNNPFISFVPTTKPNYYLIYYISEKIGWIDFDLGIGWIDDDMLGELMGEEFSNTEPTRATDSDPLEYPDIELDPDEDFDIEW